MTNKLLIGLATAVVAATAALFGGVLAQSSAAPVDALSASKSVEDFKAGFGLNASTTSIVAGLQASLAANGQDEHSWMLLGLAYQQRARETGDPSFYTKSDGALHRAIALDAKDSLAWSGLGSLALSRHRFAEALRLGRQAHALSPTTARNYGVIADAEIELGRYRSAFHDFDTMNRLQPSLSSYARVSYGRELIGHTAGAIRAMKLAVDAATDATEPTAWTHVQLGKLYFGHGRLAAAVREFRLANATFPNYAYALDALAVAEAAQGHIHQAVAIERSAVALIPLPQYVATLGDLYAAEGRHVLAQREYALIGDRAPAPCERRPGRPRDRAVRHRPRDPPATCPGARADRPARAPLDRRQRRARLGARPQRKLPRGARVLEARAPARDAGRVEVLPPRDDRAVPRGRGRRPVVVPAGPCVEPALLDPVVARREAVRGMRRLALIAVALVALAAPVAASAHPLGNFTINRYSELDLSGNRLYVVYVLDLAEIPTFQARQAGGIDGAAYARRIATNTTLSVDGRPARLVVIRHALAFPQGQGGLKTTRLEVLLAGPTLHGAERIAYADRNYAGRIGWRELVVRSSDGGRVLSSTAPASSISERLLAYPKNLLQSPLDVGSATASLTAGSAAGPAPALLTPRQLAARVAVRAVADSGFAALVARRGAGGWFLLASLAIAFFWGAAHALSPGHGKSIVTAYLVGSRGTARHALLLGATVTVTHTIGVFALGLVTLSLSQFILPEQLYPWLNLVSALLIVGVGLSVLRWRVGAWRGARAHARSHAHGHDHSHAHGHSHGDDHGHSHDPALGLRRLLGIGISGGLIPCPSALVVLLAAISLHRVGYGLVLIVAFSFGLAATMSGLGLAAVAAKSAFRRFDLDGGAVRLLPAVSAVVVLALGLVMTVRALPHVI